MNALHRMFGVASFACTQFCIRIELAHDVIQVASRNAGVTLENVTELTLEFSWPTPTGLN
jgi:hypothetical protein